MVGNVKKPTIGLLVGGIGDKFTVDVCQGIMNVAKKMNINFVVYPGKYINRDLSDNEELRYEYQFNTLFSYPRVNNIDGLIVSMGAIGTFASSDNCREFLKQYQGIPIVIVAGDMDGYVNVKFDNYAGIRDALEYLIRGSGCKKIGMIGGNTNVTDAKERKNTFFQVLSDNGIDVADSWYVEGTLSSKSQAAYKKLLDQNSDMEAVFCANDDTAMGFYKELKERNIRVGKDMLVVGFDDSVMAAKADPPLASVRADAGKLAMVALEKLISMIDGEQVESEIVPTKLVLRDSIGYTERERKKSKGDSLSTETMFYDIFFHSDYGYNCDDVDNIKEVFHELISGLVGMGDENENLKEKRKSIRQLFEKLCNMGALEYAEHDNLVNLLERIYSMLKADCKDMERRYHIKSIFSDIYLRIIRGMNSRFGKNLDDNEENNYKMKLFIRDMLAFERGNDQSYTYLIENLDWLKVENAYIYMFERPIMHLFGESIELPEKVYLKAVRIDGKTSPVLSIDQEISIRDIFNNKFATKEDFGYTVLPLFNNENLYGLLVCDLTEEIFENGEFLTNQMSSAAKMIMLLQDNEEIQKELEDSLASLKANNIELDNLSKSDLLTGIYNRRGFYIAAEEIMARCRQEGKSVRVAYIDMNNLKIINDKYGHEEGDFSLKTIGDTLVKLVGTRGVVGRIGGDEFACILDDEDAMGGDMMPEVISKRFEYFNESSDKLYNITVSVGTYRLDVDDSLSLEQALTMADERLYEMKKLRKKTVAK